jgi:Immunoglobulin I-set domain/Carboxypeptidase regulatory-like domain
MKSFFSGVRAVGIVAAVILAGCGGGGGGGGGSAPPQPITYQGNTAQATITAANAKRFFDLMFGSVTASEVSPLSASARSDVSTVKSADFQLGARLRGYAERNRRASGGARATGTAVAVNETDPCTAGGTVRLTGSIDDQTGLGDLAAHFTDCNDLSGVLNGDAVFHIRGFDIPSLSITDLLIDIQLLRLTNGATDLSTSGSIASLFNPITNISTETDNTVTRDNTNGRFSKTENLVRTANLNILTLTVTGRVFDSVEGFVDASTTSPLQFPSPSALFPFSGGPLVLAGAGNTSLVITPLSTTMVQLDIATGGTVDLTATIAWGSTTPPVFAPPVPPPTLPSITAQPQDQAVLAGDSVSFSVTATGTAPLGFQWKRDGTDISGATASTLMLTNVQLTDSGAKFSVVVSNAAGSITSAEATLTVSPPAISGTVTDDISAPLSNIQIVLRRYSDKLIETTTRTDGAGHYSLQPPAGDYIIAAVNDGTASFGASEWWTSTGGTGRFVAAEKFAFSTSNVTRDFVLQPGARITGTITAAADGTPIQGIVVRPREVFNQISHLEGVTAADGTYVTHVAPGDYFLAALNATASQAFATQLYNPDLTDGAPNAGLAKTLTLVANTTTTADMMLIAGHKLSGTVTDPVTGPVPGVLVLFLDPVQELVELVRTAADGSYTIWLAPAANYGAFARGQTAAAIDLSATDQTRDFGAAVGTFTATIKDSSNNPVTSVKARLRDTSASTTFLGTETSVADGSVTVYAIPSSSNFLEFFLENNATVGSSIYNAKTGILSGSVLTGPAGGTNQNLGTINLPDGAILKGTVTVGGVPQGNAFVQVRVGGDTAGDRFVLAHTKADGGYSVSLPAGLSITRLCSFSNVAGPSCPGGGLTPTDSSALTWQYFDGITLGGVGTATTQDFSY